MKTNAGANRILPSAILILFLISNLSLTARTKPLPYSAASIILPAIPTAGTTVNADLLNTSKGIINPLKYKMLNHATYKTILKMELIERLEGSNPGGEKMREYGSLLSPVAGCSRSVEILNIFNSQLNRPL